MTESELFAVMCGGLASIAGSVMAGYAGMGVLNLSNRSFIYGCSAGLLFAKILIPQTEKFNDTPSKQIQQEKTNNILDAAATPEVHHPVCNLLLNVGAMLIAFVALIALLNGSSWHYRKLDWSRRTFSWHDLVGFLFAVSFHYWGSLGRSGNCRSYDWNQN